MATITRRAEPSFPPDVPGGPASVDFESGHKIINRLVEALQRSFKRDTRYTRPLITPQTNIIFALDIGTAEEMIRYMTSKLAEVADFETGEFRFIRKSGIDDEVLQRLRLEFPNGVNALVIRKLLIAIDRLERVLPAC